LAALLPQCFLGAGIQFFFLDPVATVSKRFAPEPVTPGKPVASRGPYMTEKETLRQLLHDLSTPISVLLLLEDQMPADANETVLKLRQIVETYRKELNSIL
jgi:hypothetical protein